MILCLAWLNSDKGLQNGFSQHQGDMNPCPEFVSANALESRRQLNLVFCSD